VNAFNSVLERGLALSLVFLFHSVPEYVAGDWLVELDGRTNDWLFMDSKYLASMDAFFDYKNERKDKLSLIRQARQARIRF
jgi:hypothetical protein